MGEIKITDYIPTKELWLQIFEDRIGHDLFIEKLGATKLRLAKEDLIAYNYLVFVMSDQAKKAISDFCQENGLKFDETMLNENFILTIIQGEGTFLIPQKSFFILKIESDNEIMLMIDDQPDSKTVFWNFGHNSPREIVLFKNPYQ